MQPSPQTRCCASSRRRSESTGRRGHRGFGCSSTPYCSFSVRAFDELKPYVADERVQLAIIPISIIDHETNGQSTSAAEASSFSWTWTKRSMFGRRRLLTMQREAF